MSERHGRNIGQYEEAPEWFKENERRTGSDRFFDGCHRYGWIISPVLSAVMSAMLFAYFVGGVNSKIDDLQREVLLLKQQVFSLAHITRGFSDD